MRACGSLRSKHDLVAEKAEASDETLGCTVLVEAVEVIVAQIGEGDAALEHVEDRDQDLVGDGHGRLLRAHPGLQAMELVAQIGALGLGRRDCGCDQDGLQEGITLAGATPLSLPRAFTASCSNRH